MAGDVTAGDVVVVLCTAPPDDAERLARALVDERLCACVNVLPRVRSFFRWQGEVDEADEQLLVVKTAAARADALRERLVSLHSYDVPEVLVLPVADGLPAYLRWVVESVAE